MSKQNFAWLLRYRLSPLGVWNNVAIFSRPRKAKRFAEDEECRRLDWEEFRHLDEHVFAFEARAVHRWQIRRYQFDV